MNNLIQKLTAIEDAVAQERGGVVLFAIFEREDLLGKWDLVFSAPWVEGSRRSAIDYLVEKTRAALSPEEFLSIARFVPLRPSEDFVRVITQRVRVEHGLVELHNLALNGLFVPCGYVITAQPQSQPAHGTRKVAG